MINRAPATEYQMRCLEAFLKPLDRMPPFGITYGKAREALAMIGDDLNRFAIEALGLQEGDVREWENKYYFILTIFDEKFLHKVRIQSVRLVRQSGSSAATVIPHGKPRVINPHEMLYLTVPVDLATWYPLTHQPLTSGQYDDEPDF
jgi:hypothetical protein